MKIESIGFSTVEYYEAKPPGLPYFILTDCIEGNEFDPVVTFTMGEADKLIEYIRKCKADLGFELVEE